MSSQLNPAPIRLLAAATVSLTLSQVCLAQQFVNETATRFPAQPTLEWTNQLTIGDLDNDGDLDIVFANGGNFNSAGTPQFVRVFINDGTGVFTDESTTRMGGHTGLYRGVELGDVENDGDLDILLVPDFGGRVRLFRNNGNGFFSDATLLSLPTLLVSSSRGQFGDIDNDGDLDIYVVNGGPTNRFGCGNSRILINNGVGIYTDESALRHPPGTICGPMDAIFGDVNNNFNIDIRVAALGNNNSKLYINDGAGFFTNASATVPADSTCYSYDFGDINGNGMIDMFGANALPGNSSDMLIRNNGDGTWTNVSSQISPNPNVDDNDSKFFDYDNDGDLDLIVARIGGTPERIYNNDGNGNFTQVNGLISNVIDSTMDIMVADLTGNGKLDIVTGQGESGANYQNKIYINYGPADTIPPTIGRTEQQEDTLDNEGPYIIRASITDGMSSDRNFFDKGIFLNYSHNGGKTQQVPMRYSGGTIYRAALPGQPNGIIEYYVTAIDYAGNLGTGPTLSFRVGPKTTLGDLNDDGHVDVLDLLILLGAWGDCPPKQPCLADLNNSGTVDVQDLLILLGNWG